MLVTIIFETDNWCSAGETGDHCCGSFSLWPVLRSAWNRQLWRSILRYRYYPILCSDQLNSSFIFVNDCRNVTLWRWRWSIRVWKLFRGSRIRWIVWFLSAGCRGTPLSSSPSLSLILTIPCFTRNTSMFLDSSSRFHNFLLVLWLVLAAARLFPSGISMKRHEKS